MDINVYNKLTTSTSMLSELLSSKRNDIERDLCIEEYLNSMRTPQIDFIVNGAEWFNVSEPLTIQHLKGKVVILDFFTYCCINCMHILPDLKELEEKFSIEDGVVVVGIHSAKFENEKMSANILSAVQRYNISHPVVNDVNSEVWDKLNICCWPTLLIISPLGNPLFIFMGEGHKDDLFLYVKNTLNFYKKRSEIRNHQLPIALAQYLLPKSEPLLFPGKITYYKTNSEKNCEELLAVSDTGNHRIVILTTAGVITHVIGGKEPGLKDGFFNEVKFNAPQGLVFFNDEIIYVADTDNHAIRKIDLQSETVTTIAGCGIQGIDRIGGKQGTEQEISSPWDICVYTTRDMDMSFHGPDEVIENKHVLLIAMAGTHQIWALFLEDTVWWKFKKYKAGSCVAIVGSGKEENRNNMYPHASAFAQPSGLALSQETKELFIADSESSCIRRISLEDGKVTGVVGGDKNPMNLFAFGDVDGQLYEAKLQHPLGVAWSDSGSIYVADTYNHKIKQIDASKNAIITLCGNGKPGDRIGQNKSESEFNEPGGLCIGKKGKYLYIADTNNHSVRVLDVTKKQPAVKIMLSYSFKNSIGGNKNNIFKTIRVNSDDTNIILNINFKFKPGLKLTENAPNKFNVSIPESWTVIPANGSYVNPLKVNIKAPNGIKGNTGKAKIDFNLVTCEENTCMPMKFTLNLDFTNSDKIIDDIENVLNVMIDNTTVSLI